LVEDNCADCTSGTRRALQGGVADLRRRGGYRCTTASGRVVRGQTFEQRIGDGLAFRLTPDPQGWTIGVIRAARPEEDYAGVATPPYRGINPRYVEGWHFRNLANTGPTRAT